MIFSRPPVSVARTVAHRRKGRRRNCRDRAGRTGRTDLVLQLWIHVVWLHHHGCRPEVAATLRDLDEVTLAHGAGDKGRNRLAAAAAAATDAAATVIVVLRGCFGVALLDCAKVRNALNGHRSGIVGQLLLEVAVAGQVFGRKVVLDLLLHRLQSVVVVVFGGGGGIFRSTFVVVVGSALSSLLLALLGFAATFLHDECRGPEIKL